MWIAQRVREHVPRGVAVSAKVFPRDDRVQVWVWAPWWRLRCRRRQVLDAASLALADAPAGLIVRIEWR